MMKNSVEKIQWQTEHKAIKQKRANATDRSIPLHIRFRHTELQYLNFNHKAQGALNTVPLVLLLAEGRMRVFLWQTWKSAKESEQDSAE